MPPRPLGHRRRVRRAALPVPRPLPQLPTEPSSQRASSQLGSPRSPKPSVSWAPRAGSCTRLTGPAATLFRAPHAGRGTPPWRWLRCRSASGSRPRRSAGRPPQRALAARVLVASARRRACSSSPRPAGRVSPAADQRRSRSRTSARRSEGTASAAGSGTPRAVRSWRDRASRKSHGLTTTTATASQTRGSPARRAARRPASRASFSANASGPRAVRTVHADASAARVRWSTRSRPPPGGWAAANWPGGVGSASTQPAAHLGPDPPFADPVGDDLLQTGERTRHDEQHVGGVDLDEFLVRMLATTLRGHRRLGALQDLQQCLLYALAGDVAGDRRVLALAGDLVDLVDVDDAGFGTLDVIVGGLDQLEQDVLDVLADIAGLGQCGGVGDRERDVEHFGQGLCEIGLAAAGGAEHQDVRFG